MVSLMLVNGSHHWPIIKWFLPCLTLRHSLTCLHSYDGSRNGDQDPGSSFINPGCEEIYIHYYADKFMADSCVHTVSIMDMILEFFHTCSLSMGMPTTLMIIYCILILECFLQASNHCLWSNIWHDKALQSLKLIFQTSHFRGQSVTRHFITMTLEC